eukprot:CAMPEP_0170481614 /NCGR_PEP_ID=MMETSP0208-20121228/1995_1 /TAXON_ID=197538 /ORGANISM="Strombidium inclinatum, Strain S3" /LENGTH=86 /DNA_ID=CAMNT_0010754353 /DNA_START=845 /DNA_END=1105 /DNA_ORIENTATION=-
MLLEDVCRFLVEGRHSNVGNKGVEVFGDIACSEEDDGVLLEDLAPELLGNGPVDEQVLRQLVGAMAEVPEIQARLDVAHEPVGEVV